MKTITCDSCGKKNAKSFKYALNGNVLYKDLCMDCMQDFVLENQVKLTEVTNTEVNKGNKGIILG